MSIIPVLGTLPRERFTIYGVQADEIDDLWPLVVDGVARGSAEGVDPEMVRERVRAKKQQLWVTVDEKYQRVRGVVVSEIVQYDLFKSLSIVALWGELTSLWMVKAREKFKMFARANGCTRIEAISKGRVLQVLYSWGFRGEQTFVSLELKL
jgi:hypothetical protein